MNWDDGPPLRYDRDGKPISFEQWGKLRTSGDYYRVAFDVVGEDEVSTVWLGLDHNYLGGPPLIFETMIFPDCSEFWRYATAEQALAGHEAVVAELRVKRDMARERELDRDRHE